MYLPLHSVCESCRSVSGSDSAVQDMETASISSRMENFFIVYDQFILKAESKYMKKKADGKILRLLSFVIRTFGAITD